MWTREKKPNNMFLNDPKGELLREFYVRGTVRGFEPIQFNLTKVENTDVFNPLLMPSLAAREGDITKCAQYIENISEIFFPQDGGDDPVWSTSAANAFKRAVYGMIDYFLEEEREVRVLGDKYNIDPKALNTKLDKLWGQVTLYNVYQFFVYLSSRKKKNPLDEFVASEKGGIPFMFKDVEYIIGDLEPDEYDALKTEVKAISQFWENQKERDLLSVYFSALDKLPKNQVRTLVEASNAQLKSISGAEKMLSSVYGISLSAMSFFTDPTISQLTSGLPSQNVDLSAMSFPRKCGIRFNPDFMNKYHLVGFVAKWSAYEDINFTKRYGKEFDHQDVVSRTGWTRYYFEGKFPKDKAYIKLELYNSKTDMLNRVFYFEFTKSYRTTVDGRFYMKDRVLNEKIISDGFLIELKKYSKKDGSIVFKKANTTFEQRKFVRIMDDAEEQIIKINAIRQTMVKYTERPKMIFAITPPHLKKYARIILIMIKQMVDLNFDSSYLTKESQKPLLKTRFMLDE